MKKSAALALASVLVAASASMASASPGAVYPGDHIFDYDPINQAYEWQLNNDGGVQPGHASYASVRHAAERARTVAPARQRTSVEGAFANTSRDESPAYGVGYGTAE